MNKEHMKYIGEHKFDVTLIFVNNFRINNINDAIIQVGVEHLI